MRRNVRDMNRKEYTKADLETAVVLSVALGALLGALVAVLVAA